MVSRKGGRGEEGEGGGVEEEVDASPAPAQWPPVRGRAKGKARVKEDVTVPATPARGVRDKGKAREVATSPGEGRVVTTEHILMLLATSVGHTYGKMYDNSNLMQFRFIHEHEVLERLGPLFAETRAIVINLHRRYI